jgi:hypothetical protein
MLEPPEVLPSSNVPLLEARSVGETAERAVLSLDLPRDEAFKSLHSYLAIDEPAVHLMPLHFLPRSSRGSVERGLLHPLGVAAKLEYARSRLIDEIVDLGSMASLSSAHRLHEALTDLIFAHYSEVLSGRTASTFFQTLTGLYARHAMSVAIDGSGTVAARVLLGDEEYPAQVRARNGSFRASVDAVLLLVDASEVLLHKAQESWHLWVLGAQLYDDALDVEEDFESGNSTWTVARTLARLHRQDDSNDLPDRDGFYEAALTGGELTQTLAWAESCFESSAHLAETEFPSWAALQRACIIQTRRLREDIEELTIGATRKQE